MSKARSKHGTNEKCVVEVRRFLTMLRYTVLHCSFGLCPSTKYKITMVWKLDSASSGKK
jgi:hypothetical protein